MPPTTDGAALCYVDGKGRMVHQLVVLSQASWRVLRHVRRDDLLLAAIMTLFGLVNARWALRGDLSAALFVLQEALIVMLVIGRRPPQGVAHAGSWAAVIAWIATLLPLLLRADARASGWMYQLGFGMQLMGAVGALLSTGSLGRSFGVVAANRGIQHCGVYRVVRHPLYASYAIVLAGLVVAHPTWWNISVLLVQQAIQLIRIHVEEATLAHDPAYVRYQHQVRYRLIPGVW